MKAGLLGEPAWALGSAVWLCAALVFPLHLGSTGAGLAALAGYLLAAAGLLLAADVLYNRAYYRSWSELRLQFVLFLLGLLAPVAAAFALGQLAAPSDPAFDDPVAASGMATSL